MIRKDDLFYERFVAGDFPEKALLNYSKQFTPDDKKHVAELYASNREIWEKYPLEQGLHSLTQKLRAKREKQQAAWRPFFGAVKIGVPLLAGLMLILLFGNNFLNPATTRVKGGQSAFFIYKKTQTGAEFLQNLASVQAGDSLQLAYKAGNKKYGAIISVDSSNTITYHFPLAPGDSLELTEGEEHLLPYSYRLDNSPGFEMFFFITSNHWFSLQEVVNFIRNIEDLRKNKVSIPGGVQVDSMILVKGDNK